LVGTVTRTEAELDPRMRVFDASTRRCNEAVPPKAGLERASLGPDVPTTSATATNENTCFLFKQMPSPAA
jgi:hypothetical protein